MTKRSNRASGSRKVVQRLRGHEQRITALEQDREPPGRVDLIRTIEDEGISDDEITVTVREGSNVFFRWDDSTRPGMDYGEIEK